MTRLGGALLVTACVIGAGIGGYAGSSEPISAKRTVTVQPTWADGCGSDADCAAMEQSLNDAGLYLTGGGAVSTSPLTDAEAEGETAWDRAWLNVDCDDTGEYPCLVPADPIPYITGPDGVQHYECVVILTTAEDSTAVCADGTEWPS